MKLTILGCGSSAGVPHIVYGYGDIDQSNPKNKRTRSSAYLEVDGLNILIDASPDLREQLFKNSIRNIDAILLSHEHYDHTGGIPELKPLFMSQKKVCPLYGNEETIRGIKKTLWYLVNESNISVYKPILSIREIGTDEFEISNGASKVSIMPFDIWHGYSWCTGFRIKNLAYTTDVVQLSDAALEKLENLDCWIVDCMSHNERPAHANIKKVLSWTYKLKPKRVFLTHMDFTMDYESLIRELPENIRPAYDGLVIDI